MKKISLMKSKKACYICKKEIYDDDHDDDDDDDNDDDNKSAKT